MSIASPYTIGSQHTEKPDAEPDPSVASAAGGVASASSHGDELGGRAIKQMMVAIRIMKRGRGRCFDLVT